MEYVVMLNQEQYNELDKYDITYLKRIKKALEWEKGMYIGEVEEECFCLALLLLAIHYDGQSTLVKRLVQLGEMQNATFAHCLSTYKEKLDRALSHAESRHT